MSETSPYLLLDTALADSVDCKPWLKKKRRPAWVSPIYDDAAIVVSPVLIDIELAVHCNRISEMMALANALSPPVHASIIETNLNLQELTVHLKKFICIVTKESEELSLRFADCVVLSALSNQLDHANWNAFVGPISRWMVHQVDGSLTELRKANNDQASDPPILLSEREELSIRRELATHQILHNLSLANPALVASFSLAERCELVQMAARKYAESQLNEVSILNQLALFTLATKGAILTDPSLAGVLLEQSDDYMGRRLNELSAKYE